MPADGLTPIEISSSQAGDTAELVLRGELDPHTSPDFDDEVAVLLADASVRVLVLDLAGLSFIDSSGIRSLIRTQQALARRDGRVVLRAASPATRRLLELTNLETAFEVE